MNILIEAVGSPGWGSTLPYLRTVATRLIGVDIDPYAFGLYEVDKGFLVPTYAEPRCFAVLESLCRSEEVDLVIPSIHEGLPGWAGRAPALGKEGVTVLVSPPETIEMCYDKWETHRFFAANRIPTPRTALTQGYDLIKPRVGRGGSGIYRTIPGQRVDMEGMISQEFIEGSEFSIDALCDFSGSPLYIVIRRRLREQSGISVVGQVTRDPVIEEHARRILNSAQFVGPINIQCFRRGDETLFTEINPRISGGLSLSMAATENWFEVIARWLRGAAVKPVSVRDGLVMMRSYQDHILDETKLLAAPRELESRTETENCE